MAEDLRAESVTKDLIRATKEGSPMDKQVIRVIPPNDSSGKSGTSNLFEAVHSPISSGRFLWKKNKSKAGTFEIWYENQELKFVFVIEDKEEEKKYRRQLAGEFEGIDVNRILKKDKRFPTPKSGFYYAACELGIKHHYYDPLGTDEEWKTSSRQDPYQSLLNELDTKDDTISVIQFGFKAALPDWNTYGHQTIEDYADMVENKQLVDKELLFRKHNIEHDISGDAARRIRERQEPSAYIIKPRIFIASKDKTTTEDRFKYLLDHFKTLFKSKTGQSFVTKYDSGKLFSQIGKDKRQVLSEMIRRVPPEGLPKSRIADFKTRLYRNNNTIVCTSEELAEIAHIPGSITVDGIEWKDSELNTTLPPQAKDWTKDEIQSEVTTDG